MRRTALIAIAAFCLGGISTQAFAEKQPHMRDALAQLEKALGSLRSATADKGGHRVKAISLTEQAIAEVRQGIEYDNKH